ncbi:MAG: hypothetical protein ACJAW8_001571 [Oleispira sp.]|jgi:hypothetical protein
MKKLTTLSALSAAAIAIPCQGDVAPTDKTFSYRYTHYQEADSPRERTFTQETGRYQIDVSQFGYRTPVGDSWYVNSEVQYETMSGASPTQTYKDADGKSTLIMSGASIEENRIDIKVAPKKYFSEGTAGGLLAVSKENDYQSVAFGLDGTLNILDKQTTLVGSFSVSNDELSPTDADLSVARSEADGRKKRSFSLYEGISQVIDKYRTLQAGIGFTQLTGYLSDPYKFEDRRPESRDQITFSVQYKQYANVLDGAALHSNYRYYYDDWGIASHTIDLKWAQSLNLGKFRLIASPLLRYYSQEKADFYSLQQTPAAGELNSSDYRLSSYGAFTMGFTSELKFQQWALHFDWQQYISNESLALFGGDDDETPGLVNFSTVTAGIDYKF